MNSQKFNPNVFLFSLVVSFATLFLIFMGGLVTSTGSGLSVPDWPLSFGQVFPPMVGGVIFEHSHRLAATAVGILTIILIVLVILKDEDPLIKRTAWVGLTLLVLQGALGGITVLMGLPPVVSIFHACLGQAFLCVMVTISVWTSPFAKQAVIPRANSGDSPPLHGLAMTLTGIIFVQLILGAAIRHGGRGLNHHMAVGVGVAVFVHWLFKRVKNIYQLEGAAFPVGLKNLSLLLLMVTDIQILLGLSSYFFLYTKYRYSVPGFLPVVIVTIHVMIGALLLASSVMFFLWAHRTRPAQPKVVG